MAADITENFSVNFDDRPPLKSVPTAVFIPMIQILENIEKNPTSSYIYTIYYMRQYTERGNSIKTLCRGLFECDIRPLVLHSSVEVL
jgi:hypothetical protein